tara:strand:+ start:1049 stop:1243 length:195 start_codon:yes stop_codon:yes gene_type:complete
LELCTAQPTNEELYQAALETLRANMGLLTILRLSGQKFLPLESVFIKTLSTTFMMTLTLVLELS